MDIGFKVSDIALVALSETRRLLYKLLGEELFFIHGFVHKFGYCNLNGSPIAGC